MRRITLWLVSTVAVVVLVFSYRTSSGGSAPVGAEGTAGQPPGIVPGLTGAATVVNGSVANTVWGPVQVRATIANGRLTEVAVLQQPHGTARDAEINAYALPVLRQEVLQAQGTKIDTVTGATVTSGGYVRSLQAALDSVH